MNGLCQKRSILNRSKRAPSKKNDRTADTEYEKECQKLERKRKNREALAQYRESCFFPTPELKAQRIQNHISDLQTHQKEKARTAYLQRLYDQKINEENLERQKRIDNMEREKLSLKNEFEHQITLENQRLMAYRQRLAEQRSIQETTTDRLRMERGTYLDHFGKHAF